MLKKASGIIIWSAVKAAGAAVIPVTVIRVPLLTKITANMATNVITAYGYGSLSGLSNFFSIALGAASGVRIANEILARIPGIGSAAASLSTAGIHLFTGAVLVIACEMIKAGKISDAELQDKAFCKLLCNSFVKKASDIVFRLIRGQNPIEGAYV